MNKGLAPKVGKRGYFTLILLALEILFFSVAAGNFLTRSNVSSVLINSTEIALIAIGMTMIMLLGGIDISVGSSLGVVAILTGRLVLMGAPPLVILLAAVAVGGCVGLVNGSIIVFGGVPDIIATIGVMYILRAAVFGLLGGEWITGLPDVFGFMTSGSFMGIPFAIWVLAPFYGFFYYLLTRRPYGRRVYATGSDSEAAYMAGINVRRTKLIAYIITGGLVGLSSLFYVSRMGSVEITVGNDLHMQVIAATVIGGTSVLGGRGSLVGTLCGVFFMTILRNGINLMGVPSLWERVTIGIFIVISVTADIFLAKKKR